MCRAKTFGIRNDNMPDWLNQQTKHRATTPHFHNSCQNGDNQNWLVRLTAMQLLYSQRNGTRLAFKSRQPINSFPKSFLVINSGCLSKGITTNWANLIQCARKIQKVFWTKQNVDNYFHHNFCRKSKSHHRINRVSRRSKKNKIFTNYSVFAIWKPSNVIFSTKKYPREGISQRRKKGNCPPTWQVAWFSKSLRLSQQSYTDCPTATQNWNWFPNIKCQSFCSLLWRYSWTFQKTNTFSFSVGTKQQVRFFHQKTRHSRRSTDSCSDYKH